jgi:hypothetical protein
MALAEKFGFADERQLTLAIFGWISCSEPEPKNRLRGLS